MAARKPSLKLMLASIPAANRHVLDEKIEDMGRRARIARSLSNWRVVAQFMPELDANDIEGIDCDNPKLELKQYVGQMYIQSISHCCC